MSDYCRTRYPLLLVHGAGWRDLKRPVYWGRIPAVLESEGARIYYGQQDAWGSVETNARSLARRIGEIRDETGCEKVNVIAHSKGGLDARMAASSYGCGDRIASITTIATPHRGSATIDRLFAIPRPVWSMAAFAVNNWIRVIGDDKPDFLALCRGFTTDAMDRFNRENPDVPSIFYQSYACLMRHPFSDIHLSTANWVLRHTEGPNDGLVSVRSARWGSEFHILQGAGWRGISHLDAIDLRRAPLCTRRAQGVWDICQVYREMVHDLKLRSF